MIPNMATLSLLFKSSLQDLQFDIKYGYLLRLTPSQPILGQGYDDAILKQQ